MCYRGWPKLVILAAWLGAWSFLVAASYCGNGAVESGEGCDDGNITAGDGCSSSCQTENGWTCTGSTSVCTPICGDGLVVGNELCDDGANNGWNRACLPTCLWNQLGDYHACTDATTCGIEHPTLLETCDDGPYYGSSSACYRYKWNICGDREACTDATQCGKEGPTILEQCDDGGA